jgi:chemotaxis protein CheD
MIEVNSIVKVGIADLNMVTAPGVIRTSGLGSCVGVVIYDDVKRIAGLSHILLPDSNMAKQAELNAYKYADTAIPILVNKLIDEGARKYALKAKLAGGAQMFHFTSNSDIMRIGPRNSEAALAILQDLRIPVIAADTGGNVGRTIEFNPETSKLKIKKASKEEQLI